jgi:hypothetical protein
MEILISIALVAFVLVAILTGFTQQQVSSQKNFSKNLAVTLAEQRLEETIKFPATQLVPGTTVDYIVPTGGTYAVHDSEPNHPDRMRRTLTIAGAGDLMDVGVRVEYGYTRGEYPFFITLSTRRGN